jgi:hypothetical protein
VQSINTEGHYFVYLEFFTISNEAALMEVSLRWTNSTENLAWTSSTFCYHHTYIVEELISGLKFSGGIFSLYFS